MSKYKVVINRTSEKPMPELEDSGFIRKRFGYTDNSYHKDDFDLLDIPKYLQKYGSCVLGYDTSEMLLKIEVYDDYRE